MHNMACRSATLSTKRQDEHVFTNAICWNCIVPFRKNKLKYWVDAMYGDADTWQDLMSLTLCFTPMFWSLDVPWISSYKTCINGTQGLSQGYPLGLLKVSLSCCLEAMGTCCSKDESDKLEAVETKVRRQTSSVRLFRHSFDESRNYINIIIRNYIQLLLIIGTCINQCGLNVLEEETQTQQHTAHS